MFTDGSSEHIVPAENACAPVGSHVEGDTYMPESNRDLQFCLEKSVGEVKFLFIPWSCYWLGALPHYAFIFLNFQSADIFLGLESLDDFLSHDTNAMGEK